ncbi:MAG: hypothetical protein ACLR8P_09440 [Clostridium fessum]
MDETCYRLRIMSTVMERLCDPAAACPASYLKGCFKEERCQGQ